MEQKKLQELIREIDALKKAYEALLPMKTEDENRLWRKFRLEWNYNSNHLEGNTLTYGETSLLLFKDRTQGPHTFQEFEEMKAHDLGIYKVLEWAKDKTRKLTEVDIRWLNKLLLIRPFRKNAVTPDGKPTTKLISPGEYKEHPNHVLLPDGQIFEYATPEEVPPLMNELINWYNNETSALHPLLVAATLHYRIVRIHPFDDGNGRVARLLMNYHLLKEGYPPVIIKSEDKNAYLTALARADAGELEAFVSYIAEQLVWSLKLAIKAAKGEEIEAREDWKKQLELLKRKAKTTGDQVIPKSPELVEARIRDSIIPLLRALDTQLKNFDELFLNQQTQWFAGNSHPVNSEDELVAKCLEDAPSQLRYIKKFVGYKYSGTRPFNMVAEVHVSMEKYYYSTVLVNTTIRIPAKKYDTPLSKEEIEEFIGRIGKYFTDFLEEKTKGS